MAAFQVGSFQSGAFQLDEGAGNTFITYSYSATGGLYLLGSSVQARGKAKTTSGGVSLSGLANRAVGVARTTVGGLSWAGVAAIGNGSSFSRVVLAVGGFTLSGVSNILKTSLISRTVQGVGGLVLRGTSAMNRAITASPLGGGIVYSGRATLLGVIGGTYGFVVGTLNDVVYQKLQLMGHVGSRNDMLNENIYWRGLAEDTNTLSLNEVKKKVLKGMGYTGTINNMEKKYWEER